MPNSNYGRLIKYWAHVCLLRCTCNAEKTQARSRGIPKASPHKAPHSRGAHMRTNPSRARCRLRHPLHPVMSPAPDPRIAPIQPCGWKVDSAREATIPVEASCAQYVDAGGGCCAHGGTRAAARVRNRIRRPVCRRPKEVFSTCAFQQKTGACTTRRKRPTPHTTQHSEEGLRSV